MRTLLMFVFCNLTLCSTIQAQLSETLEYHGCCDASAAVALDDDHFLVANDEDKRDELFLRLYHRDQADKPLQLFDLKPWLNLTSKHEVDLEGATAHGNVSYWISSHGTDKDAGPQPNRRRLFAIETRKQGNKFEAQLKGRAYADLVDDLIADPALAKYDFRTAATVAPKKPGALNIEGLAYHNDTLLIGFRNPVPAGKALILPLLNPAEVLEFVPGKSARAKFGPPVELNLGSRGIRSLEYSATRNCFWIIAGPIDNETSFAFYSWKSGESTATRHDVDFQTWNPEALVLGTRDDQEVLILSDDGERKLDDVDPNTSCKKLPADQRRFRGGWLKLP